MKKRSGLQMTRFMKKRFRPHWSHLFCFFAFSTFACVPRNFNNNNARTKAVAPTSSGTKSTQLDFGVRKLDELLSDLGDVTNTPPANYEQDTDKTTLATSGRKSADGSGPDLMRYPAKYWNEFLIPAQHTPLPLAAKTVLQSLRNIREKYWLKTPTKDESKKFDTMSEDQKNRVVARPGSAENGCLDNSAAHWSDLQIHYFCALPRVVRACYRTLAPNLMRMDPTLAVGENRRAALELCLHPQPGDLGEPIRKQGYGFTKELQEFYETQWVTDSSGKKVNIFDYIMFAQTYAFDPEQEQAVLNTFYADLIDSAGKGENHDLRTDENECAKARPLREIEQKSSGMKNDCVGDKEYKRPLISEGR